MLQSKMSDIADFITLDSVDSTNNYAKKLCGGRNIRRTTVITAKTQTAGRGRQGKSFHSPAGGLYMSVILKYTPAAEYLTVMCGVAVCRALKKTCGVDAGIKWVNDIFLGGRKVCGILCESVVLPGSSSPDFAVAGVGINLNTADLPEDIRDIAGSVACGEDERGALCESVAGEIIGLYSSGNAAETLEEYRALSVVIGKRIDFTVNGRRYSGTAVGIDEKGGLIADCGEGRMTLRSGEVSLSSEAFIKNNRLSDRA